uniref:Pao retrotransposon peptidase family protein n=1 Tax=Brugia malayi TaxID=6279 RepID=A8Q1T1_BRUMA
MNIRGFLSNNEEFNAYVPKDDKFKNEKIKVLDIPWDYHNDTITTELKSWKEKEITKRNNLQFIASQYDPLGLIVPINIKLKLFFQDLWKKNYSWDKPLEQKDLAKWQSLIEEWPQFIKNIPRKTMETNDGLTMHVFTDASAIAYSAVYIPTNDGNERKTSLIFSKVRLAPIKVIAIPRLELMGALIGVRAVTFAKKQLELEGIPTILWSD